MVKKIYRIRYVQAPLRRDIQNASARVSPLNEINIEAVDEADARKVFERTVTSTAKIEIISCEELTNES